MRSNLIVGYNWLQSKRLEHGKYRRSKNLARLSARILPFRRHALHEESGSPAVLVADYRFPLQFLCKTTIRLGNRMVEECAA